MNGEEVALAHTVDILENLYGSQQIEIFVFEQIFEIFENRVVQKSKYF